MNITLALIIGFVLFIVLGVYLEEKTKFQSSTVTIIYSLGILSYFFGGLFLNLSYQKDILYEEEKHKYYIESLGNETNIEGHIGLFSGSIEGVEYYFFFTNTNSGLHRKKLKVQDCYLIEGDKKPQIKEVFYKYKDEDRFWKVMDDLESTYYKIYIPKGTVIREYKVR